MSSRSRATLRRRFAPKCLSRQQPAIQRPMGGRHAPLHWLLVTGCWLLEHFGRRPSQSLHGRVRRVRQKHEEGLPRFARSVSTTGSQHPAHSGTSRHVLFTGCCSVGCWLLEHFGRRPLRARREDLAENLAMLRHVVLNVLRLDKLAMLRHVVLNVLRLDKSVFGGISVKRKELTWDDDKLLSLMLAA